MRKTLTLISLGLSGLVLAGCDTAQDGLEPVDDFGAPPPAAEPDVQIGQGDPFETPEPASPGTIEREIEPTIQDDLGGGIEPADDPLADDPLADDPLAPQDPVIPPPQN